MPREAAVLVRELLGRSPDAIEPLVVWHERATWRVTIGGERFVVKTDDEHHVVAREAAGQQRAAGAGVPVPEIVAVGDDAFAMRWVDGVSMHARPTSQAWRNAGAQIRVAHELGGGPPFGTGFGGSEATQPTWRAFFELFAEGELRNCERLLGFPADQAARIRAALRDVAPLLDAPRLAWCHGDFQADHVLVDPATERVASIIDWADHGAGDMGWDVAVLALDDATHLEAFLDGYDADEDLRTALAEVLPLFTVVRLFGSAYWLAEHDDPLAGEHLRRAIEWRA